MTAPHPPASRAPLATLAVLCAAVVVSRVALRAAGLPFVFDLDWMWMADPADLRDRLLETLYWYHAFPPGMNLLTGLALKAGGMHAATLAMAGFWALGLVFTASLFHVGRALGLSTRAAAALALAFMLSPPAIYFEHLWLYEWPVVTLLTLAAALFYEAVRRQSTSWWLGFFAVCGAIGAVRSTFHLVWVVAMAVLGAWFARPGAARRVLAAALVPVALLGALYAKNYVLVGTFAASTFGPAAFTLATVGHLPPEVRAEWQRDGRLSPVAAISEYAAPREYQRFFGSPERAGWPPQITRLEQVSVAAPNFNHWWLTEVHRWRSRDAMYTLRTRPVDVLRGALFVNLVELFAPSTQWHPYDRSGGSPHQRQREVLGGYEAAYNRVVHSLPVAPVGLYVVLPLAMPWALAQAFGLLRRRGGWSGGDTPETTARAALLCFALIQITYVVAASSLLTSGEMSRYRFQAEPLIWVVTACAGAALMRRARAWRSEPPASRG